MLGPLHMNVSTTIKGGTTLNLMSLHSQLFSNADFLLHNNMKYLK